MSETFDYSGEDSKKYKIIVEISEEDLFLNIVSAANNDIYSSNYYLNNLNEKFLNVVKFKTIKDFKLCLSDNIKKKSLILKSPYKNIINSIWKVFPTDKSKEQTFTLISSKSSNKKISIYSFYDYSIIKNIVDELKKQLKVEVNKTGLQSKDKKTDIIQFEENWLLDNIYCLNGIYTDKKEKEKDFFQLLETDESDFGFRKLIILFDEDKILDYMVKIIKKFYQNQIFILFFTKKDVNTFRDEINSKLDNLKETYLSYFNTSNIFINDHSNIGYKRAIFPLIKVFCYFNQLGDGFYKQLVTKNQNIEGLEDEIKYLLPTHFFNILLYGRTGVGKSTFINKIMGEKKSFTLKAKSIGTERNNFYVHKDYPIKIIDVCGFAEGNEAKENLEKINLIYKKESSNILIDEPMNDIFSFYGDKRNNIHLLLYFNVFDDRYDIFPGELPMMYDIIEKKIPIIFVVNKCPAEIFDDEDGEERDLLKQQIDSVRKDTDFEKYKTFFVNCIKGYGFDQLLKGIYEEFKKHIIKDEDLINIKNLTMPVANFNQLFEHSFFFGDISPQDVFLNESLVESVIDIKKLIVRLAGYYSGELGYLSSLNFYFFDKLYNQFWRNATKNFFPLLTDLVKKIYSNFGFEKTYDECNNFIKHQISQYFNLQSDQNEIQHEQANEIIIQPKNEKTSNNTPNEDITPPGKDDNDNNITPAPYHFSIEQFTKDYKRLIRLYWYSKDNFRTNDTIQEDQLKTGSNLEETLFNIEDEKIDVERLLLLIKRDFGLDNSKRDATNKEKIYQKLFYISYTCNELISSLCETIKYKEIKYTSIFHFYYTVSMSYNKAIQGFLGIRDQMSNEGEDDSDEENSEAPPVQ